MAVFIVRSGRNILPATRQPSADEMTDWPWALALARAFDRLRQIPMPA